MSSKRDQPYGGKLSALDALFGETPATAAELVPIEQIVLSSSQPRRYFGGPELQALTASVKTYGVLQPLLVRPLEAGKFVLVAGERRLRAAKEAGLDEVPAVVRDLSEEQASEVALLENLQREDLNPLEETQGYLNMIALRLRNNELFRNFKGAGESDEAASRRLLYSLAGRQGRGVHNVMNAELESTLERIEEVFRGIGRMTWQSFVKNRLPLLDLPENVLKVLKVGGLEYTKAMAIAKIKDEDARGDLLKRATKEELSLAQIKAEVHALTSSGSKKRTDDLSGRASAVARALKRRDVLQNKRDQKRVEKLLAELETLLFGEKE